MKNILMAVLVFSIFIIVPVEVEATPQCSSNATPNLQLNDPACYTKSTTSGYYTYSTKKCTWTCGYPLSICNNGGNLYFCSDTASNCERKTGHSCGNYSSMCYDGCGDNDCQNAGIKTGDSHGTAKISTWHNGSTSYKCYYTKVNTWGTCDIATGVQSATSVTQHSLSGASCDNKSDATTRTCAACGIASNTPIGDMPTEDLCIPFNTASTPILNTTTNMWEWTCTADNGSVDCNVSHEADGMCSSTYSGVAQDWAFGVVPPNNLCESGTQTNFVDLGDNGWTWDCKKIGDNPTHSDKSCAAPCFDYKLNIDKKQFYWSNQDDVEINVNIEKLGRCSDQYSCSITIDNDTVVGDTHTYTIDARQGVSAYDVSAVCSYNPDSDPDSTITVEHNDIVSGNCVSRTCSSQGTCQSTPQSSSSYGACVSTCSSDADCSSGRMIETRP